MRKHWSVAYLVLLVSSTLLTGCSDATGPSAPNLAGTWRFVYSNMAGTVEGVTIACNIGADFTITQTGSAFSGVQVGPARMTCSALGQPVVDEIVSGETIVNGQATGASITFRLGSIQGQSSGTVNGTSMSGTAQWLFVSGNSAMTLNGNFTAAKL